MTCGQTWFGAEAVTPPPNFKSNSTQWTKKKNIGKDINLGGDTEEICEKLEFAWGK